MKLRILQMQEVQIIAYLRWSGHFSSKIFGLCLLLLNFCTKANIWLHLSPFSVCILSTCCTSSIPFSLDRVRCCCCLCFTLQLCGWSVLLSTFSVSCLSNLSPEHLGLRKNMEEKAKRGARGCCVMAGEKQFNPNEQKLMQIRLQGELGGT